MEQCGLCGSSYRYEPHYYGGQKIRLYDLMVCNNCWRSNWNGWNPIYDVKLLSTLERKGLPIPERKVNGLLPRD